MPSSSPEKKPSLRTLSGIQGLARLHRAVNDVANAITREALAQVIEDGGNFLDRPQRDRDDALLVISYAQRLRDGLLAVGTRADLNKFGFYIP